MNTIRTALFSRFAAETGKEFFRQLEERLTAKFSAAAKYAAKEYSREVQPKILGQMQHSHVLNEVVEAGTAVGLSSVMTPTAPKGHHYAKVVTNSFILGGTRLKSESWTKAKFAKELAKFNTALEPIIPDMFDNLTSGESREKIFLVAAVIEDPTTAGLPYIFFCVPFSTLDGYHFKASIDEVRELAEKDIDINMLEPLVILKKRLDDKEREIKEA